jgi:general secretion pathway protein A
MYESYFGLKEKPFSIQPDPDFLFFSNIHRMAYTMLEYGVENRAGFTVITGEIGSGKTTLVRCLLDNLSESARVGLLNNMHRGTSSLLEWVLLAFGRPYDLGSQVALFDAFQQFLISEYTQGRRTILIIDEAHNLSAAMLEELRLLSNINADKHQLLQMILIGQPQLQQLLNLPELQQFAQRVAVDFRLRALPPQDVQGYIQHRLEVAGRTEPIFLPEACSAIARASEGIPRKINILCDTAMVYAMSLDAGRIDLAIVNEVIRDRREYGVFTTDPAPCPASGLQSQSNLESDRQDGGEEAGDIPVTSLDGWR